MVIFRHFPGSHGTETEQAPDPGWRFDNYPQDSGHGTACLTLNFKRF
jgi:hypothetical protein